MGKVLFITTYEMKYPKAQLEEEVEFGLVKGPNGRSMPCWNCKRNTTFIDLDFGAYICSNHCRTVKWDECLAVMTREQKKVRKADEKDVEQG